MYVCHHLDEDWRAPVHPDTPTDPYPHSSTGVHHFQIASYTSMYSTIILQLSFLIGLSVLIRPVGRGGDSRGFAQTQRLASKCLCTTQLYILSALVLFVSGPLVLLPLRNSYVEDYTNHEYKAFFEIGSSGNWTWRILLKYYCSDVAVSFLQNLHSNRKVTNRFAKKAHWPFLLTWLVAALSWTW